MKLLQQKRSGWLGSVGGWVFRGVAFGIGVAAFVVVGCGGGGASGSTAAADDAGRLITSGNYTVLAYNDLGMHCMNQDFSEICVLPPANTLRATVIKRGEEPRIVTSGVSVDYSIPGNTTSYKKTNFWKHAQSLFGVALASDMGLFGYGMKGLMKISAERDFAAQGIPITPIKDNGVLDPYQLGQVNVTQNGKIVAATQNVVPVSWEMTCNSCHNTPGMTVEMDILSKHDKRHGTKLVNQKPVLCAKCHADPALGAPGVAGVKTLSAAMHGFHKDKFADPNNERSCYTCHPGPQTQCMRDVHKKNGLTCSSCHQSMAAVANPARKPWVDEPKCSSCHNVRGHQYEQPGKLFRESKGHGGVKCIACHGSPHAITPSTNPRDNVQSIALQGVAGPIGKKCTVCHTKTPSEGFEHKLDD